MTFFNTKNKIRACAFSNEIKMLKRVNEDSTIGLYYKNNRVIKSPQIERKIVPSNKFPKPLALL